MKNSKSILNAIGDSYSPEEKELIVMINVNVMNADGIAEQWGGYSYDPLDYLEISIEIFNLTKKFFNTDVN